METTAVPRPNAGKTLVAKASAVTVLLKASAKSGAAETGEEGPISAGGATAASAIVALRLTAA